MPELAFADRIEDAFDFTEYGFEVEGSWIIFDKIALKTPVS